MTAPYRVGTTSYIVPADLQPNIEHLAGTVEDIELILFDVDDGPGNLPNDALIDRMKVVAAAHGLSYTVHLPLDINLGEIDAPEHPSMVKAAMVIEKMRRVEPHAYVVHAEGRAVLNGEMDADLWRRRTVAALQQLGSVAGGVELLAVENLEGYPLDFLDPIMASTGVSACVDIGHLWLEGHDAMAFLERRIERTRVIHLHGIGSRDHQSLAHMPAADIEDLRRLLERTGYSGVVTLEVFNQADLDSSLAAFEAAGAALVATTGGVDATG